MNSELCYKIKIPKEEEIIDDNIYIDIEKEVFNEILKNIIFNIVDKYKIPKKYKKCYPEDLLSYMMNLNYDEEEFCRIKEDELNGLKMEDRKKIYKKINEYIEKGANNICIIIKGIFSKDTKVEDVYRYDIDMSRNEYHKLDTLEKCEKFSNSDYGDKLVGDAQNTKILLLLESPHEKEYIYDEDTLIPIAPAQGNTGKNIEKYLDLVINEMKYKHGINFENKKYSIIICNPVPYQTSLKYYHKKGLNGIYDKLRNDVWEKVFKQKSVNTNFLNKLKEYKSEVIINACTGGCTELVEKCIEENKKDIKYKSYIVTSHPASWRGFGIIKK